MKIWTFDLIFAEFGIPPFHSTIPVHHSSPVIVDYHSRVTRCWILVQNYIPVQCNCVVAPYILSSSLPMFAPDQSGDYPGPLDDDVAVLKLGETKKEHLSVRHF